MYTVCTLSIAQKCLLSQLYGCVCVIGVQSCLDLKNYEAVFALMEGLENRIVQQAEGSWQVQLRIAMSTQHSHLKYISYIVSVLHCVQMGDCLGSRAHKNGRLE